MNLRVINKLWHNSGIFFLQLDRQDICFEPGDCLALFAADGETSRPYSIASGTTDAQLEFIIREMPGGAVSGHLARLEIGDEVKVSPPFGWFRPGDQAVDVPFVFCATGTGISPFMAYLRSAGKRPPDQLFHGVREASDLLRTGWLQFRCGEFLAAVSREEVEGCCHGRITDLTDRMLVDPAAHYYLCGLDGMIDELTTWLEGQGIPLAQIHRECFFNDEFD